MPSAEREGPQLLAWGARPLLCRRRQGGLHRAWAAGQERTPPAPPSASIRFTFRVCPGLFVRRLEIITSWFFQKQIGPRHNAEPLLWLSTCISGGNTERVQKSAPARTRSFGSLLRGSALPPQLRSASALGRLVPRCTGVVLLWTCSLTLGCCVVGKSGAQVFFFFFFKHIENKRDPPT